MWSLEERSELHKLRGGGFLFDDLAKQLDTVLKQHSKDSFLFLLEQQIKSLHSKNAKILDGTQQSYTGVLHSFSMAVLVSLRYSMEMLAQIRTLPFLLMPSNGVSSSLPLLPLRITSLLWNFLKKTARITSP
jgi:hypothetical protein